MFPKGEGVETNLTREEVAATVSRIVNQQIDVHDYVPGGVPGGQVITNLSAMQHILIVRTGDKKEGEEIIRLARDGEFLRDGNCTEEIIKDIQLSRAGYRVKSLLQQSLAEAEDQIFCVMKLDDALLDSAYEGVIKQVGAEFGYRVIRVDEVQDSGRITDQVLDLIAASKIVLADLSCQRPNCYYEAGFAHALGREIIFTIRKAEEIHFNLKDYRFIEWSTEHELREKLRKRLEAIQDRGQQVSLSTGEC
jgi:hypothetical protein